MEHFWNKELSGRSLSMFMLTAHFLYIFPLLLADFPYIDDHWVSQYAHGNWLEQGRPLTELAYNALTLTSGSPNIFPLPLLIATAVMAFALCHLARHYFARPSLLGALVPLPLFYNPFFLQNLTYQYDGAAMILSLAAMVYAITCKASSARTRILVPGLMIAIALSLYQMSLNVFLGLACIEVIRHLEQKSAGPDIGKLLITLLLQLVTGLVLYWMTAYFFMTSGRDQLLPFNNQWIPEVIDRLFFFSEKISLLFNTATLIVSLPLLAAALLAYCQIFHYYWKTCINLLQKSGLCILAFLLPFALLLLIPGVSLLFRDFNNQARVLMGFSTAGVALFYLVQSIKPGRHYPVSLILIFPIVFMTSLSYAYGRVLTLQKELSAQMLYSLAYDLDAQPRLKQVTRFHFNGSQFENWLPAAEGTFRLMPVIKYILNANYLVMPQMLPRAGITQIGLFTTVNPGMDQRFGQPVVDRKFYSIHVRDDEAYIFMKRMTEPERYPWKQ